MYPEYLNFTSALNTDYFLFYLSIIFSLYERVCIISLWVGRDYVNYIIDMLKFVSYIEQFFFFFVRRFTLLLLFFLKDLANQGLPTSPSANTLARVPEPGHCGCK